MTERLFGIETEFGLVGGDGAANPDRDALVLDLVEQVRAACGSVSDSARGIFLQNGARFYGDAGHHPEWSSPEVGNPWDAARYTLAGERVLTAAAAALASPGRSAPILLKTNTDPLMGVSWGCHESVMHRTDQAALVTHLIPFLVSRIIVTGAGGFTCSPGIEFVVSPRAHFLQYPYSSDSTGRRGIFHTKEESLSGHGYRRLHVLCGESLNSEIGMWLRSATLVMVVALIEGGVEPGTAVTLKEPVGAMHAISRDLTLRHRVERTDGKPLTALEIQRHYLRLAEAHVEAEFMPPWAGRACDEWRIMLDRLEVGASGVAASLDWAIRLATYTRYLERRGFTWDDVGYWTSALERAMPADDGVPPADLSIAIAAASLPPERLEPFLQLRRDLLELDIRFGQLGDASLFGALDRDGVLLHHVAGVENIDHAIHNPPAIGRAAVRGAVIRRVQSHRERFEAGWDYVLDRSTMARLDLSDPFETDERWGSIPGSSAADLGADADLPAFLLRPRDTREEARQYFMAGDYPTAERLLTTLLHEEYEVPSVLIHLARVHAAWPRALRARRRVEDAWALRGSAPRYVVARTLWFKVMFALQDGADPAPWLGQLKWVLSRPGSRMDWTMGPVLERMRARVPRQHQALLRALHSELSGEQGDNALETYELWRDCEGRPLDEGQPAEPSANSG